MTDRDPVYAAGHDEAEISVLGAAMLDPVAADEIIDALEPGAFEHPPHQLIFLSIWTLRQQRYEADPLAVRRELDRQGLLDRAGGAEYLARIVDIVPTAANRQYHIDRLRHDSDRRRLLEAHQDVERAIRANGKPPGELYAWMLDRLRKAAPRATVDPPRYRTLGDYLDDPDVLKPPTVVIPRLLWRQRLVMLAAEEKLGKSTFMAAGAAAASAGQEFLGEGTAPVVIAYVTIDEPAGSTVANLHRFGGDRGRLILVTDPELGSDRLQGVENAVRALAPDGTVIDSLWKLSAGKVERSGDAASWGPVLDALTRMAHDYQTGVLFSHHVRKSDGKYRDSSAIGAAVDAILEMAAGDAGTRKIEARARWPLNDFEIRLHGDTDDYGAPWYYTVVDGELSLDARILLYLENHPGSSMRAVDRGVTGRTAAKFASIRALIERGAVEDRASEGAGSELFAVRAGSTWEAPREAPPRFL